VNSKDQDLLERAAGLFNSIARGIQPGDATPWLDKAKTWLAEYEGPLGHGGTRPGDSRWRDIDPAGDVATAPTPEPPDEADEGETGPPEQDLP
jgi:hypothetical protein